MSGREGAGNNKNAKAAFGWRLGEIVLFQTSGWETRVTVFKLLQWIAAIVIRRSPSPL